MNSKTLHLGLSGVVLPYPKYKFPQELQNVSRLTLYSSFFNSIEINESFYKIPQRKTIERWASSVPENFKFTFKLNQDFTHKNFFAYDPELLHKFIDTISAVGVKSGCILVQFPPGQKSTGIIQLEKLLNDVKSQFDNPDWNIAVEFRDPSWYNDDTFDLLREHNTSLVLHDISKSIAPFISTAEHFIYVRFHGPTGNYRGSYTEAFLQEYAEYIMEWLNEGKNVFVYFNNTAGNAFENGRTLQQLLDNASGK
jgi:uncharacterized protein YecE (DUF72 family)